MSKEKLKYSFEDVEAKEIQFEGDRHEYEKSKEGEHLSINELPQNYIPDGIRAHRDAHVIYIMEAKRIYNGYEQGGTLKSNLSDKTRYKMHGNANSIHFDTEKLKRFSPLAGTIENYPNLPTYCDDTIIAEQTEDNKGYLVYGPYLNMTAGYYVFHSFFNVSVLAAGIAPNDKILTFEIGHLDASGNNFKPLKTSVLYARGVSGGTDSIYTTIPFKTNNKIDRIEQRIYWHGKGYVQWNNNWCIRPHKQL